jgi:PX domain
MPGYNANKMTGTCSSSAVAAGTGSRTATSATKAGRWKQQRSIWLGPGEHYSRSLIEVRISGFDSTVDDVTGETIFQLEVSFGHFTWQTYRNFTEFKNFYKQLCRYDRSTFDRLIVLFPLRANVRPIRGSSVQTTALKLDEFLSGLVERVDFTLYAPLASFLCTDEALNVSFIPALIQVQKRWRGYRDKKSYAGVRRHDHS